MDEPTRPALDPEVDAIRAEVEQLTGEAIEWRTDPDPKSRMRSTLRNGLYPQIWYRDFSQEGALEELLHIRLRLKGCPSLACHPNAKLTTQTRQLLENVVHHQIIYPEIRQMGYEPSEDSGIAEMLEGLIATDLSRIAKEPPLQALFAAAYVRSRLDTDSKDIHRQYDAFFSDYRLGDAVALGNQACEIILNRRSDESGAIRDVYERCIDALGIEVDIVD